MFAEFETALAAELNAFSRNLSTQNSPSAGALRARDRTGVIKAYMRGMSREL
jgi:hypothetical protein